MLNFSAAAQDVDDGSEEFVAHLPEMLIAKMQLS